MTDRNTFFELLQAGVWGRKAKLDSPPMSWQTVFDMVVQQSVAGVTLDALQSLPKDYMPEQKLLFKWISNACVIEKLNKQVNEAVSQLVSYLDVHSVPSRLMKGQGCASLYPHPLYRQSGDIDLFVGVEQYERAKNLIHFCGINIEHERVYDAHFTWGQVKVEMHRYETKLYWPSLNRRFQLICRQEEWREPLTFEVDGQRVAMFNATFNAFYIFVHFYHHFLQAGIGLRQVCDWMLIMKHYEHVIDWKRLHDYVTAIGAERAWNVFYGLTVEYLGVQLETVPEWMREYKAADVQFVLDDILKVGNFGKFGKSMQKRSFGGGFMANMESFIALFIRLLRISKFGRREVLAYPLWKVFCDRSMFNRYKSKH